MQKNKVHRNDEQRSVIQPRLMRKKRRRLLGTFMALICIAILTCIIIGSQKEPERLFLLSTTAGTEYNNANAKNEFQGNTQNSTLEEDWCLTLVNKWNPITNQNRIELAKLSNGEKIDKRIYPYLQNMFDAARNSGIYPIVASGYRTEEEQKKIYEDKVAACVADGLSNADAKREAKFWVAIPGTSEHQLGLAVDINGDGVHSKGSEVYEWLKKNAHRFGFINRYPSDKVDITGVANEPWHYRYVGVEAATKIYNEGICLEEYLGKVNK